MHKLSYYENVLHGTAEFPVAYYFVDENHARYDMPFHWHKEWELIRILKGSFTLTVDNVRQTANAGDCFLLSGAVMHGGTPKDCIYECLVFDLHTCIREIGMIKKYLRPLYRGQIIPNIYYPAYDSPIPSIASSLMNAMHSDCPELSVLGELCRLLSCILENHFFVDVLQTENTDSRKIALLKPVLEYIEGHYQNPMSLDELSHIAGMNPRYFCRFFSSLTGQTPMNYVRTYRLEQAALLLESGETNVTQAGLSCGFTDIAYFIKCFRKHRGLTPKEYQKSFLDPL